jgi:hypothetical protein
MVTGIEIAGLVLATIPMVVKRLDDYAAGIRLVKAFGNKSYSRQLRGYAAHLGGEEAILFRTFEMLLEDVVDREVTSADAKRDQWMQLFEKPSIKAKLRRRLGNSYDPCVNNLQFINDCLSEIQTKLGPTPAEVCVKSQSLFRAATTDFHRSKIASPALNLFQGEFKKFRDVFWRTDYEVTLQRITDCNGRLRTLVADSQSREYTSGGRRGHRSGLTSFRGIRKYTRSLHNALCGAHRWQCSQSHSHLLSLRLGDEKGALAASGSSSSSNFALILWSRDHSASPQAHGQWLVKEFQMRTVTTTTASIPPNTSHVSSPSHTPSQHVTRKGILRSGKSAHNNMRKAAIAVPLEAIPWTKQYPSEGVSPELTEICSHLLNCRPAVSSTSSYECVGSIKDINDNSHFYELYVTQNLNTAVQAETLHDVLASDLTRTPLSQLTSDSLYIWKNRLTVAAILATSVLQLQGSWMDQQWGTKDIVLANDTTGTASATGKLINLLYLTCRIPVGPRAQPPPDPVIQSQLLFPLGLALTELACLQPIDKLRLPEDDRQNPSTTNLATASRLLNIVRSHCGANYAEVVRSCLFWPGPGSEDMDDEDFQNAVYDKIVQPLREDLDVWFSR